MNPNRFSILLIWMSVLLSVATRPASAQPPKGNGKNAQKAPPIEINGKLLGWQANTMTIVNDQGQSLLIGLPQKSSGLTFKAPMMLEGLAKGMFVRVEAPAAGGKFLEPFKAIEVIIPDTSSLTAKSSLNDRSRQMPGIYPMSQVTPPTPGQAGSPNVRVVGAIAAIDATKMALQCGNKSTTIELAPDVKIEFVASTLRFATSGDRVRAMAQWNPATGQLLASRIEVSAIKPIGSKQPTTPPIDSMKLRVKEKAKASAPEELPATTEALPDGSAATPLPSSDSGKPE